MHDGSLNFYDLEANLHPLTLRELIGKIEGVRLTGSPICDPLDECWFDFEFRGEPFSVNNPYAGAYGFWFFSENPKCDPAILSALTCEINKQVKVFLNQSES